MTRGWTIPACHDFYPRPPRGGRLVLPDGWEVAPYFYPRPPRGGRQGKKWSDKEVIKISIHALREEGDQRNLCTGQHSRYFYPRPPRGGRRAEESVVFGVKAISIHALREEGDVQTQTATRLGDAFLSTPSARRATVLRDTFDYDISISIHALREEGDVPPRASFSSSFYFYPRPPRGGRLDRAAGRVAYLRISIHALREEGDSGRGCPWRRSGDFYPRPPRGGRPLRRCGSSLASRFLSTPSARRATERALLLPADQDHFYPRPPRGGRPLEGCVKIVPLLISIHALREEGDLRAAGQHRQHHIFLSTPSARRATGICQEPEALNDLFLSTPSARRATADVSGLVSDLLGISIHALREEGDILRMRQFSSLTYFYPRPPRGGRRQSSRTTAAIDTFLSTPSARRATAKTETKSLFSNKLYNILHEFRRALIYNGSKNDPNHAKRLKNPVRRCRKNAEDSPFAPGRKTQNNSRPSCSKGG